MRDRDIRAALRTQLAADNLGDSSALVIDEMEVCSGSARIDIALVNGSLSGYEIKSEQDTLVRLPTQQSAYCRVFDAVTIVVGAKHIDLAKQCIPEWWGIIEARGEEGAVDLHEVRRAEHNNAVDKYSLAQLLWRDEALAILRNRGLAQGTLSKPRRAIWKKLSDSLAIDDLQAEVRQALKKRTHWRSDSATR